MNHCQRWALTVKRRLRLLGQINANHTAVIARAQGAFSRLGDTQLFRDRTLIGLTAREQIGCRMIANKNILSYSKDNL